ncbi:MAG: hypothetical protein HKN95_07185 [Acidimicrobiia bacterium]|nr:hypothetical protein [Acidimicrobiia bacterium]
MIRESLPSLLNLLCRQILVIRESLLNRLRLLNRPFRQIPVIRENPQFQPNLPSRPIPTRLQSHKNQPTRRQSRCCLHLRRFRPLRWSMIEQKSWRTPKWRSP